MITKDNKEELERVLALLLIGIQLIRREDVPDTERKRIADGMLSLFAMISFCTDISADKLTDMANEIQERGREYGGEG